MKAYVSVGGVIVVLVLLLGASTVEAQRQAPGERHQAVSQMDSGIARDHRAKREDDPAAPILVGRALAGGIALVVAATRNW